jgi:hypothetical protein
MLDVLHAMRAFHGPLPATWDEFQRTTADAFTGGLYDTKHVARQHDAVRYRDGLVQLCVRLVSQPQQIRTHICRRIARAERSN